MPVVFARQRRFVEFRSVVESFKQAVADGDARERSQDGQDPSRERRGPARRLAERGGEIAPEVAFLASQGVGPGPLLQAMRVAERCGVDADAALLGEGLVAEEVYFRALARHLGVPYFCDRLAIADDVDAAPAIASGIAPLAPNLSGLRAVVAPRGASVRFLVAAAAAGHVQGGFAISSPQRLSAFVRAKAGSRVAEAAACGLERRDASLSAHSGLSWGQIACVAALAPVVTTLLLVAPSVARGAASILLWLIFGAWIVVRNLAVAAAGATRSPAPLADANLPVYSIVAPLYREPHMVGKLVKALDAIDYPRAKLDIKLVVERRDEDTLTAIASLGLPARYDVIVAPPGAPSTKPRALNVALPALRGDFVVVYDAEDEPDPDQLRLAAAQFAGRSRPRLPAGASDDRQRRGFLDQQDVRDRIRGAVRSGQSRARGARPADRAGRHLQSFPHADAAARRRMGRLERHRGRRPRHPARARGRARRRALLGYARRGAERSSPPGSASACAGRRAGCRP